ncbi:MAG: sigma-70 family RNA polymerase sigma factor [Candidatus Aminicenantes bacterium]|nr:sigma-70 family RNA polymerase sigma factor [Candidatus Aminicenantes bacterium]
MENDGSKYAHDKEQVIHPLFDDLYEKYQNAVFGFAYYLTQNRGDAEDLFQEAWLRIAKKLPDEVKMKSIKAWIFTIVANLHRDELRKKRVRRLFFFQKAMSLEKANSAFPVLSEKPFSVNSDEDYQADMGRDITQALARLPDRQRRVFVLKEIADFRQAEISDILGIPVGTVKSLMHRAVSRLRRELWKYHMKSKNKEEVKCDVKTSSV